VTQLKEDVLNAESVSGPVRLLSGAHSLLSPRSKFTVETDRLLDQTGGRLN
jgi:hypothetical protein